MTKEYFEIEPSTPFSESLIWQLNREFYLDRGISAWSDNVVPHNMTSSSLVGRTYAELIFAFLKDLAVKGKTADTVYILELGAGHGRLAFHILQHMEKLERTLISAIPPYCFVLSDIVEDNLSFFLRHSQFQKYFEKGRLEVSYFDATESEEIHLRYSGTKLLPNTLNQPLLAIANYFFDSIPVDLYLIQEEVISNCSVSLQSQEDPAGMNSESLIRNMEANYQSEILSSPVYSDPILNEILNDYKNQVADTYLFFPAQGIKCLDHLNNFSPQGLMLLSMDKGFHELHDLENKPVPDLVTHGSFSLWVNYHALGAYCEKKGGRAMFPTHSTFHLNIACLQFLPEAESYEQTTAAYEHFVNDFGPDDFNSIKKLSYFYVSKLKISELIALYRLSFYDSTFFINLLPRLKSVAKTLTFTERKRIAQTMHQVWAMYFSIGEKYDLAYELGGLFYDLGYYPEALSHFENSANRNGEKADIYYNKVLCHYQLREDALFQKTLAEAKVAFPGYERFEYLDRLDMS